jgi:hypothetical protein
MSMTLVFAQFGDCASVLDPSLTTMKRHFPECNVVLYTDSNVNVDGVDVIVVNPPYARGSERYGNRCNDYYKVHGLLEADTPYAIAMDSDMHVFSERVRTILPLTEKFGFCLPVNPRHMVYVDNTIGADSDKIFDESEGCGHISNMSPISLYKNDSRAREVFSAYLEGMITKPIRGPVAMWNAIWKTGNFPCLLPIQWCVCAENCGVGNEIMLHVGHQKVKSFYGV